MLQTVWILYTSKTMIVWANESMTRPESDVKDSYLNMIILNHINHLQFSKEWTGLKDWMCFPTCVVHIPSYTLIYTYYIILYYIILYYIILYYIILYYIILYYIILYDNILYYMIIYYIILYYIYYMIIYYISLYYIILYYIILYYIIYIYTYVHYV